MAEQAWVQSLAALVEPGTDSFHTGDLLKWAKGKGKQLAPNLALVRNPEVTISWLAQEVEKGNRPDRRARVLSLPSHRATWRNGIHHTLPALRR